MSYEWRRFVDRLIRPSFAWRSINTASTTNLIESFWLLQISQHELQKACELYDQGTAQTQVGAVNDQATSDLGSLGILLIEMFTRIQTVDPRDSDQEHYEMPVRQMPDEEAERIC